MSNNWTDADELNPVVSRYISYSTPASNRAKVHLTLVSLIDSRVVKRTIRSLERDIFQPALEQLLLEVVTYALDIYLEETQKAIQTGKLDYKVIQRRNHFIISADVIDGHKIQYKDKDKLAVRASKHLSKISQICKIQLYNNLDQEVADVIAAFLISTIENTQGIDFIEELSFSQINRLFKQYFNEKEINSQLQKWYSEKFSDLTGDMLGQIGLERLSIAELEYFLGFQSELQLYRRLKEYLQKFGFVLGEQLQNISQAVALFQRLFSFNSFKNQPEKLYQQQRELEDLLKRVEPPLFKNGTIEPIFSGRLATSILIALLDPTRWKAINRRELAFAARTITEMVGMLLKPLNVSPSSPYSKNFSIKFALFDYFCQTTLKQFLHSEGWELLYRDDSFILAQFSTRTKATQNPHILTYQMLPLYGQEWDVQTILNLIFQAPKHLGVEIAKIHLIFCAYASRSIVDSGFVIKGSDLIQTLGWTKNKERNRSDFLNQLAQYTLVLGWLHFVSPWNTTDSYKCFNHPIWAIDIKKVTQTSLLGEEIQEILICVQPGCWIKPFLKQLHRDLVGSCEDISFLSKKLLEIDSYHHRLTLKFALYRSLHRSFYQPGRYSTPALLELLGELPEELSEKQFNDVINSLNQLKTLGFTASSLSDREALRKHIVFQPLAIDSKTINQWKRLSKRSQNLNSLEHTVITGAQIKEARLKSGLTLEQLSRKVNLSSSKLSKIENGYVVASPADLERLQKALNILRRW